MRTILFGCSTLFELAVFFYCVFFVHAVWCRLRYKIQIPWREFNPIDVLRGKNSESPRELWVVVLIGAVLVLGFTNIVLSSALSTTRIGAFYEKADFTEQYDAILHIGEKPVFCIAEIEKNTDEGETNYRVSEILLPHGHTEYADAEFDPEKNHASVFLGYEGWDCDLELKEPATDSSYALLKNEVVANYGEFCGSKDSDLYHLRDCQYSKNIEPANLIYFETQREAGVLGYDFCTKCRDRY